MHVEGKYLLVSYRDIPDAQFICEPGGDLRIKVSIVEKSNLPFHSTFLDNPTVKKVLLFENLSNRGLEERDELFDAIRWYKSKTQLNLMCLIHL